MKAKVSKKNFALLVVRGVGSVSREHFVGN